MTEEVTTSRGLKRVLLLLLVLFLGIVVVETLTAWLTTIAIFAFLLNPMYALVWELFWLAWLVILFLRRTRTGRAMVTER